MDNDESRSTCAYISFFSGGAIDFNSVVPTPVANSTAESESNGLAVASLAVSHVRMAWMEIAHDDSARPFTVPIFTDSSAALAMTRNDRDTRRTRHIDRRFMLHRSLERSGLIITLIVDGKRFQVADIITKNTSGPDVEYKLSCIEAPLSETDAIIYNRRGVMDSRASESARESGADSPPTPNACV